MFQASKLITSNHSCFKLLHRHYKRSVPIYIDLKGELLYGVHPVKYALNSHLRTVHCLYYNQTSSKIEHVVRVAEAKGISVKQLGNQALADLCRRVDRYKEHHVHQGLVADVSKLYHYPMDYQRPQVNQPAPEISEHHSKVADRPSVWLLLCSIKDPMNLGAIIRTSYFLGVNKIIVTGARCELSCVVSKASAGALELTPIYAVNNAPKMLEEKIGEGWRVVAASRLEEEPDVYRTQSMNAINIPVDMLKSDCHTVLVLGNEGSGIPLEILRCVTHGVFIPSARQDSFLDSLNVSVATGILLHRLCNQ